MPGAARLLDELHDIAVLMDEVVARHPRLGVAQAVERGLRGLHPGVVQKNDVGVATHALVVVGRGGHTFDQTGFGDEVLHVRM